MSVCISKHGEFGSHEIDENYTCRLCFAFDEDAALARIRHLEAGAADDRGPENASPTPGQLLRRWIDADPDERLAFAERAIHNAEQAHKCFLFNHRGRIAHMERLLRERDLDPTAPAHRHDRETTAEEAEK